MTNNVIEGRKPMTQDKPNNCTMCDKPLEEKPSKLLDGLPVCEGDCREDLKENGTGEPANIRGQI